jgi:phosphoribosyl 1,2-cyclic phosphate phosphodiesterase
MHLRLLGTATSQGVPVIGCDCAACLSRDPRDRRLRCSALLDLGEEVLAIDAGPDFREQMLREGVQRLDGILITHEHNDHTAGLDDVRPFCFMQKMDMPIYCLDRVAADVEQRFAYAFTDYPGVPGLDIRRIDFGQVIEMGGATVELLRVQHGQLPIIGLRIGELAYLTDTKTLPEQTLARLQHLDTLILSCLNRRGTHSHLSLDEALAYVDLLRPRETVLIHLSHRFGPHAELLADLPPGVTVGYDGMRIPILNR